jgi:membrane protease YdiL (CAAX protease family)
MEILHHTLPFNQQGPVSVALPVILTVVCYSLYWFTASSGRLRESFSGSPGSDRAGIIYIVLKRAAGFLLLGMVPVATCFFVFDGYSLADAGLSFNPEKSGFTLLTGLLLSLLIIPVISYSARKPSIIAVYPEIRVARWTGGLMVIEAATWALYLLGYETLFRGVLLLGLAESTGPVIATVVTVVLYSAAHIPKGMTETLAAIPFGIVLCIITLYTGNIWIAFFVHLVNALATSITAIKYNPEMRYAGTRKGGFTA